MRAKNYYRFSLVLPLAFPIVALEMSRLGQFKFIEIFRHMLMLSIFGGATPYAGLVTILLLISIRTSERKFIYHINWSPLYLCALLAVVVPIVVCWASDRGDSVEEILKLIMYLWTTSCLLSLALGYFYVLATHVGRMLLVKIGFVTYDEITPNHSLQRTASGGR